MFNESEKIMLNQDLVVLGKKLKDTNFADFSTMASLNDFQQEIFKVIDIQESGNKYQRLEDFIDKVFIQKIADQRDFLLKQEEKERNKTITYQGKVYNVVHYFEVLYSGWECDGMAWVIDMDGTKKLIMTNHGSMYEAQLSELQEQIKYYAETMQQTQKAVDLLK